MTAVTVCSDFGAQENKSVTVCIFFPFYLPWSDRTRCHDLSFLNVEFQVVFSLSSFTLIKSLFSSSSPSSIRVVSSAYLRLLIFLLAILIPACDSASPAFCMMYWACKLKGLMVKTPCLQCKGLGSIPCQGTKSPHILRGVVKERKTKTAAAKS